MLPAIQLTADRHSSNQALQLPIMAPVIQDLPDDILYRVFRELVRTWEQNAKNARAESNSLVHRRDGWAHTLTHVCRRWRAFSLNSSALWTNIAFGVPDETLSFLERARAAPLRVTGKVQADMDDDTIRRTLGVVLDRSEQIVALDLAIPATEPPIFATFGPRSFHNIVSLSLAREYGHDMGEITLPSFFDSEHIFAYLKDLRLHNYPLDTVLHSPLSVHMLTTFDLAVCHPLQMSLIFDLLKNMPYLEELSVGGFREPAEWYHEHYPDTIPLLHLRQLSLHSMALGGASLLDHLEVPSIISVSLNLFSDAIDGVVSLLPNGDIPMIATTIADTLFVAETQTPFPDITALAIHLSDWDGQASHIRGWSLPSPLAALPISDARLLDEDTADAPIPSFDVCLQGFTSEEIIQHLSTILPLENVQILFISSYKESYEYGNGLTHQNWQDLLVRMPDLRTLSATLDTITPLPALLRPETDNDGNISIPFPHLSRLSIRHYEAPREYGLLPDRMEELTESLLRRAECSSEVDFDFGWLSGPWFSL